MDKVALGQVLLHAILFSPPSTTPPMSEICLSGSGMKGPCETYVMRLSFTSFLKLRSLLSVDLYICTLPRHYIRTSACKKIQDILINVHLQETSLTGTIIYQILYILYEVLLTVFEVH